MFSGKFFSLSERDGIGLLAIDTQNSPVNVFNQACLTELGEVLNTIEKQSWKGMVLHSAKKDFVLGADITEFGSLFSAGPEAMMDWLASSNKIFNRLEDLPFPTIAAVNGMALGGGLEVTLACDYRMCLSRARLGLPETKLGIIPGWGGTVRLSRICGADHGIEWITSGKHYKAKDALNIGLVDSVVEDDLVDCAAKFIVRIHEQKFDYKTKREVKKTVLKLNQVEAAMAFETAKGFVLGMTKGQYPAPVEAISLIQRAAGMNRDEAILEENKSFAKLAKTTQADALIQVFLGDQYLKRVSKKMTKEVTPVKKATVLGAGIMGGGIAYQSASSGVPITMKDIADSSLELGMSEASKLLNKLMEKGRIDGARMGEVLSAITPTLEYNDMKSTNIVVEAVVENEKVKKSVLAEVEGLVSDSTVLASNTSTISITKLAQGLKRPQNFCGMHFFNPVHMMPLVEVIRGEKTSDETIAQTVAYATQMGKTPIVVNDCAGFLVNRVLFPYFNGFIKLVADGVDFTRIDKVMEKFGWPMGPAYLLDVVGVDTAHHCVDIMADAFPDRMSHEGETVLAGMFAAKRFGQKNNLGFYEYSKDKKGKPKKDLNPKIYDLIKPYVKNNIEVSDEQIVERMMFPMIFECIRCLDEKIVNTATEVDMGLLLGLGFPPFKAGALKYADTYGLTKIVENTKNYAAYGHMYTAPESLVAMAAANKKFY